MVSPDKYVLLDDTASTVSGVTLPSTSPRGESGTLAVLSAAADAWAECEPDGYVTTEALLPAVLEDISRKLPGCRETRASLDLLAELFLPPGRQDSVPIFQRMLKARNGEVHFLHFWRAFAESARLLENLAAAGTDLDTERSSDDGKRGRQYNNALTEEVELVRDTVLRTLDLHAEEEAEGTLQPYGSQTMPLKELVDLVRQTAAMSLSPAFWVNIERSLSKGRGRESKTLGFTWDDLTSLLVSWLRDAAMWQPPEDSSRRSSLVSTTSTVQEGLPVYVHIYDVSHEDNVHKLNKVLAHKRNPLKFGGVFHAGVEVNGLEWAFGMSLSDSVPGISCSMPKEHPEHRYRQTVRLKNTKLSPEQVAELLAQLIEEYPGDDYDLLRRNCCHFADDFVKRLGVGRLPGWVHRLARVGAFVDGAMQRFANRSLIPDDDDEDSS